MIIALQSLIYYYFRESLLRILDRLIQPCYKSLTFSQNEDNEEPEEQVFAEYDEEKGVVFYPPVYAQRYAAVSDCLMDERWCGKLEKVVEFGFHDMTFIKYLKDVPGINSIIGVDIESIPLRCSADIIDGGCLIKKDNPIKIQLYQGNAADPDYRLIGADAVVAIEMIEHMLPHDLERLVHTIFGFIRPHVAVITTPNGDFNVLFKALERNGLRRMDHFFEWSREQFHDWCTNIVRRYPDFTVSCRGVGPGPLGTEHLGCCSQLALFVCKSYHKQHDLSLDSLALVSQPPGPDNIEEILNSCDSRDSLLEIDNTESLTNLSETDSNVTITVSPPYCYNTYCQSDKVVQCNIDNDFGKSYLMDVDETCVNVVVPRRRVAYKVYEMEDVACRLNCTTMKVNKFSKSTQKLLKENNIDCEVDTRDVVSQIKQLARMLNLKDRRRHCDEEYTWNNINWGENAPYWNQYYKLVREYDYPNQEKSQDCIILELISDEVHQLVDLQFDEEMSASDNRLQVPMERLMQVVSHLTDDVERVRELLEWNGFEIVDGMLVHSRQLPDDSDCSSERWPADGSDDDTSDVQSLTLSDGSKVIANYHARLRRALEHKIRKLRSTAAEEDITSEMERAICRLMQLALKASRGRHQPPPSWWLQSKLYDLLTLAERAIQRRRMHFLRAFELCYDSEDARSVDTISILNKFKEDTTAQQIMEKYNHLVEPPADRDIDTAEKYDEIHLELDVISVRSSEGSVEAYQFPRHSPTRAIESTPVDDVIEKQLPISDDHLARTKAWVDDDVTTTPLDSTHSGIIETKVPKTKTKKAKKQSIAASKLWKKSQSKLKSMSRIGYEDHTEIVNHECETFVQGHGFEEFSYLQSNSKPIPNEMIELCENSSKTSIDKNIDFTDDSKQHERTDTISATEDSYVIDIITDGYQEKVALRRSVGTEPEVDESDVETLVAEVNDVNEALWIKNHNDEHSQEIPFDINEPSTSKGIRHRKADVQCGPDTTELIHYPSPEAFKTLGISAKIGDSLNNMLTASKNSVDFGTCTHDCKNKITTSRNVSVGIKIKDSDEDLKINQEETKFLKLASSTLNMDESIPEFCSCFSNSPTHTRYPSPNASIAIETIQRIMSPTKCERPKLSRDGIHVHSYKDKGHIEDIVYQGEWQRYKPRPKAQKKNPNLVTKKSDPSLKRRSVRSRDKLVGKRPTQSCDSSPSKIPVLTFAQRMIKVNQDIAKKAELGKKLRDSDNKKVTKKKSSPTSNIPKACIVSKKVTPKSSLILRKDSKKQLKSRSRVPVPRKTNDKKGVSTKATPIKITDADLVKDRKTDDLKTKIEDLKKDLFKSSSPTRNISYVVYRSEVTTTSNDTGCTSPVNVKRLERRVLSPDMNSSCSSRNSVATVRALNSSTTSPVRSYIKPPETEAGTSKQKKFTKKAKLVADDKENTSISSVNSMVSPKEAAKPNKKTATGKNRNVFVSKMNTENANLQVIGTTILSKPVVSPENKSTRVPVVTKEERNKSPNMSRKPISPERLQTQNDNNIVKEITKKITEANVVIVTSTPKKPQSTTLPTVIPETSPEEQPKISKDNEDLKHEIQRIVEESLDFIKSKDDTKSEILNVDQIKSEKELSITPRKENSGHPLNRTFDNTLGQESIISLADTVMTLTDTDFISFKSMTSVSKVSEYFLADTELDEQVANVSSVKDLFERKDQLKMQVTHNLNPIAIQAFSGLSLGAEPLVGDRPDRINLQDSETGSLAAPVNRMVISEEMFVSGRSSSSFESCWMDENSSVVPDWLFHAMNQPAADEVPIPLPIEIPPPNDEISFDENGNPETILGADAGAGDGCGMHSDYSDDSSGESSLSSSEDTSGAQSEAILIDPTAIAAHYEAFRDAMSSSTLRMEPELDEVTGILAETTETPGPRRRPLRIANSGFEADVSSLDETPDVSLPPAATQP